MAVCTQCGTNFDIVTSVLSVKITQEGRVTIKNKQGIVIYMNRSEIVNIDTPHESLRIISS